MIKIQPKQTSTEERGASRDAYLFKDAEHSLRGPLAFAAFFTGLFAYFKSVLGVQAAAPLPESSKPRAPEEAAIAPEKVALVGGLDESQNGADEKDREREFENQDQPRRPMGSGGHVFSDLLNHENLPDFDRIAALHARRQAEAQIFSSIANNDNVPPASASGPASSRGDEGGSAGLGARTGGSGSGGSTGGSGGGGDNPPRDPSANRAPLLSGPVGLPSIVQSHTLFIPLALLLTGALDPDRDTLAVVELKASAGEVKAAERGWIYTPAAGHLGPVTFSYGVSDGTANVLQTALLDVVRAPPILGTKQNDLIAGTEFEDEIQGRDGNDNIDGRGGSDTIVGGAGDDHIVAGSGNDIVYAGLGNDVVFGGSGNDIVFGGDGDDRLFGELGDDVIHGEAGDDVAMGGSGSDQLFGGAGRDVLYGDEGRDYLAGGDGNDQLFGGNDSDVLADGPGSDVVNGGAGDDVVLASFDLDKDTFEGGLGNDTLSYAEATEAVVVNFALGSAGGLQIGTDVISGFEGVIGGIGDDVLTAGEQALVIMAGGGADIVSGGVGNDHLSDGEGADVVNGGGGNDVVLASIDAANDSFDGGVSFDTLSYASATAAIVFDLVTGTASSAASGTDTIANFEAVIGGKGDDLFLVGIKPLVMTGGEGEDAFTFGDMLADLGNQEAAHLVHQIDDLDVGDRIIYKSFELLRLAGDQDVAATSGTDTQDAFIAAYGTDEDNRPFRFRNETHNDEKHTYIDVIGDSTQMEDVLFTIDVRGYQRFEYYEHA
jgi:Ca2+-binding RTX toxin-like protein